MPRMEFYNIERLIAIHKAIDKDKHDPEDTLMCQLTHREVAMLIGGSIMLDMIFPEFSAYTESLVAKLQELTNAQEFFVSRRFGGEDNGEEEPDIDSLGGGPE